MKLPLIADSFMGVLSASERSRPGASLLKYMPTRPMIANVTDLPFPLKCNMMMLDYRPPKRPAIAHSL